jgi:hypothetical protein
MPNSWWLNYRERAGAAGLFLSFRRSGRGGKSRFSGQKENGYGSEDEKPYPCCQEAEDGGAALAPRVGPLIR